MQNFAIAVFAMAILVFFCELRQNASSSKLSYNYL